MKQILVALVILGGMNALPILAQDRPAYWVHGLNSGPSFWANERNLFENERHINAGASTNWGYGTTNGVIDFANVVRANTNTGPNALAIGHSMGGLAVREVVRQQENTPTPQGVQYQGIILCGSPLRGARIMNSFQSGAVDQAIENGGWQITRVPLAGLGPVVYIVGGVAVTVILPSLRQIFDFNYVNYNASYGAPTVNDLSEQSPYMQGISTFSSSTPRVYIWGNENSPVHWRLLSSTSHQNQPWQDDEDLYWPGIANQVSDIYQTQFIVNAAAAVVSAISLNFGLAAYFGWVAFEWKAGNDYMRGNSESDWASLIGAESSYVSNISSYVTNVCSQSYYYGTCGQYQDPIVRQACQNSCWQTVSYTFAVQAGSDGLVAGYSQRSDANQWQVSSQNQYEALGVNHIEMRGHTNMTTQFRNVFDRTDPVFNTPHR